MISNEIPAEAIIAITAGRILARIPFTRSNPLISTTALVNAVIKGLGISVLPHRMILPALEHGLINTIHVENFNFNRNFFIIRHKDKFVTSSAKKFMDLCRNYEK